MKKLLIVISFLNVCSIWAGEPEGGWAGEGEQVQGRLPETGYTRPNEAQIANQTTSPIVRQTGDTTEKSLQNQGQQTVAGVAYPSPDVPKIETPSFAQLPTTLDTSILTPEEQQQALDSLKKEMNQLVANLDKRGLNGLWNQVIHFFGGTPKEVQALVQKLKNDVTTHNQVIDSIISLSEERSLTSQERAQLQTAFNVIDVQHELIEKLYKQYSLQSKNNNALERNLSLIFKSKYDEQGNYIPGIRDMVYDAFKDRVNNCGLLLDFQNPEIQKQFNTFLSKHLQFYLTSKLGNYSPEIFVSQNYKNINGQFASKILAQKNVFIYELQFIKNKLWGKAEPSTSQFPYAISTMYKYIPSVITKEYLALIQPMLDTMSLADIQSLYETNMAVVSDAENSLKFHMRDLPEIVFSGLMSDALANVISKRTGSFPK